MEKKIEKKASEVVITLTTSGEEWTAAQTKEFNKIAKNLRVRGFRPGHVPAQVARQRINPAEVLHEAMYAVVNKAYREVMTEEKFMSISDPVLEVSKVSATELEVTIKVALPPVVTLGQYKGLSIAKDEVVVSDADLEAEVSRLVSQHATAVVKEEAAEMGDTVIIDFKGYVDSVPFDGGEAKGYELKLGSNAFIPGFEDALVGIKAGEKREISVSFPENYVESLAGKAATFDVKCHDVKATVLPTLDDEFVKDELGMDGVETVAALREKVAADLAARKEREADQKRLDTLVRTIVDSSSVEIADQVLNAEADAIIKNIEKQVKDSGLEFEDYLKINNIDAKKLHEDKKAEALENIKTMLVVNQICANEKIVVDSKAYTDKCEEMAKLYSMKVEDVIKALDAQKDEVLRNIKNEMFTKFILENNQ